MRLSLVLLFAGWLLLAQAPTSTRDKCELAGQVLNSVTGEPVRKVHVTATKTVTQTDSGRAARRQREEPFDAITDAGGRFAFSGIDSGSYYVRAVRAGYVDGLSGSKGARQIGGHLVLEPGDEKRDIVVRITPCGVISGRILDEDGDPIQGMGVSALMYQYTERGRQLLDRGSASTNDLGEYRIYGLPPHRYYLKASPSGMSVGRVGRDRESYAVSYYPGTPDAAGAAAIDLKAGQELRGINLTLHKIHVATIRGRVIKPADGSQMSVMLTTEPEAGLSSSIGVGVDGQDGKFEFPGITSGSYVLTAQSTVGDKQYSASLPVHVGAVDIESIELHLIAPTDMAGKMRIEGKADVRPSQIAVHLQPRVTRTSPSPASI